MSEDESEVKRNESRVNSDLKLDAASRRPELELLVERRGH